jgi:hypothetical protein
MTKRGPGGKGGKGGGMKIGLTRDFDSQSFIRLCGHIAALDVDGWTILGSLAHLGPMVPPNEFLIPGAPISPLGIATAMAATLVAKERDLAVVIDPQGCPKNLPLALELAERGVGAEMPNDGAEIHKADGTPHDWWIDELWIGLGLQHALQFHPYLAATRTATMVGWGGATTDGIPDPDLGKLFGAVTFEQYWAILFALWAGAQKQPGFGFEQFFREVAADPRREAREIVNRLSITPADAAKSIRSSASDGRRGGAIAYHLFTRTPIIQMGQDISVFAPHTFLTMATFMGPLFVARQASAILHGAPGRVRIANCAAPPGADRCAAGREAIGEAAD